MVPDSCARDARELAENLVWYEMVRGRSRGEAPPDAGARLAAIAEEKARCGEEPDALALTRVNQAFEAWSRSAWDEVLVHVEAVPDDAPARLLGWRETLRASALLHTGALDQARRAAEAAITADGVSPDVVVVGFGVLAGVARARGDTAAEERALRGAIDSLGSELDALPGVADPAAFMEARLRVAPTAVEDLVGLLLDRGAAEEALALVRRFRRSTLLRLEVAGRARAADGPDRAAFHQAVEALQEERDRLASHRRQRWQVATASMPDALAEEEALAAEVGRRRAGALALLGASPADAPLRRPDPTEVLVLWIPVRTRWIGLLARHDGSVVAVDGPSRTATGRELEAGLLATLDGALDGMHRVTVVPWGPVAHLGLHAPRTSGGDLALVYSLDLPPRARPGAVGDGLLVVGDPTRELPGARAEARSLAGDVPGTRLLLGRQAQRDAVLDALGHAERFYYAGHGVLDPTDVWRTHLLLADGRIEVGDLLSLQDGPRLVALSGCETGRAGEVAEVASLGIAQALVLAGADLVVAASTPVPDAVLSLPVLRQVVEAEDADDAATRITAARSGSRSADDDAVIWQIWVP